MSSTFAWGLVHNMKTAIEILIRGLTIKKSDVVFGKYEQSNSTRYNIIGFW
jgi:hypothetical protein